MLIQHLRCCYRYDIRRGGTERLRAYLDGLSPRTRKRIVLIMLVVFAALALYMFGRAVYNIGKDDGRRIEPEHIEDAGRLLQSDGKNKQGVRL
ncbi:MAG: TraL conjugative transposon family protein [Prevotella sp.]|nr:TraL conjugative transposon family protein [Prevotella sp.]